MLYINVAKVDRDIAHVVMVIHVCFKCMLQMFHLFQTYVASVLSGCCKNRSRCCIYMHVANICFKVFSGVSYVCLQVFHLDVVHVCNDFKCFQAFSQVSQTLVLSVSSVFFCMLQLLYLDVSKVD